MKSFNYLFFCILEVVLWYILTLLLYFFYLNFLTRASVALYCLYCLAPWTASAIRFDLACRSAHACTFNYFIRESLLGVLPRLQTNFQFYVRVDDVDTGADDLIDRITFDITRGPNGGWSTYVARTGFYGQATVTARFRVFCNTNFFGASCTTFCQATDSSSGHYTCDANGQFVCNSGYSDPSNNCLTRKQTQSAV